MNKTDRIHKREDRLIKKEKSYRNIRLGGSFLFILSIPVIALPLQYKGLHSTFTEPIIANEYMTISLYFFMTLWTLAWGIVAYSAHTKLTQIKTIKNYRNIIAQMSNNT
ncbi:MAG: hypothetical protein GY705_14845 [Bacteroidetes bacterium]|nr:hypothetical protein [Bacteroidota bacterium]